MTVDHQNNVRSLVGNLDRIQSNENQHPSIPKAKSGSVHTDPQAKALVEILQAGGIIESGAIEGELQQIEDHLLAEPFEPFAIEMMGGTIFRVEQPAQCRFTRHGSIQVRPGDGHFHILNSEHIVRVRKLLNRKSEAP